MINILRAGESQLNRDRRARYYNQGREWYFRTREGASIGPFDRLSEAVAWAEDYVGYIHTVPKLEDVVMGRSVA